jgi:nicotinamidase/pyrazinamidase
LKSSGVADVVVCGIATNICCCASRDLSQAGFTDTPAAGLFEANSKREGANLGIPYVNVLAIREKIR